jgi:phosphate starvation-inducible protein PhoH and related proteins
MGIKKTDDEFIQSKKQKIAAIYKKPKEKFLTNSQKDLWEILGQNEITLCFGPSGVGKSHILIKKALDLIREPNNGYEKIVITRPAVQSDSDLGFLPGDLSSKLYEYMFPSFYLITKIIGEEAFETLKKEKIIETIAFSFMRGLNIDNSILICEEAQNVSPEMMKLLLTRIGFNTKFFISGDLEQSDKYFKDPKKSGLFDAKKRLFDVEGVDVFEFKKIDVVRNKLITSILEKYDTII